MKRNKILTVPTITLLLIASCLISTIPQLFLSGYYNMITGQFPRLFREFYRITLPGFTHSPDIIFQHTIGNILVILVFGSMIEINLGSRRFSILTLATFFTTTMISMLSISPGSTIHGASGICFGYMMYFLFIVIINIEQKNWVYFKKPLTIFAIILGLFSIFGIPAIEVFVMGLRFFSEFWQYNSPRFLCYSFHFFDNLAKRYREQ